MKRIAISLFALVFVGMIAYTAHCQTQCALIGAEHPCGEPREQQPPRHCLTAFHPENFTKVRPLILADYVVKIPCAPLPSVSLVSAGDVAPPIAMTLNPSQGAPPPALSAPLRI